MLRCIRALVLASSCAAGPEAFAAQLIVDPTGVSGAYVSLQEALDVAAAGDVILVHGGTYVAITIHKPVTIVGDPRPLIRPPDPTEAGFDCTPAVTLAGPGIGAVSLAGIDIGGDGAADWFSVFHAGIEGGGFTMLQVQDCTVSGPQLVFPTGTGGGGAGIETSVPLVFVGSSAITGSGNTSDNGCSVMPKGRAGIRAPGSIVVVLDSVVTGGRGSDHVACFDAVCGTSAPASPCPCASFGGEGGDGIQAQRVFVANSLVNGGSGMLIMDGCVTGGTPWGQQPDGAAFDAAALVTPLQNGLAVAGSPKIGATPTFTWMAGSDQLFLMSTTLGAQLDSANGPLFADANAPLFITVIPAGVMSAQTPIPALATLIGTSVVVQIFDPVVGLTRPVIDVIRP